MKRISISSAQVVFFLEVAHPAMLDLAKQTSDNHQLIFGDIFVKCSNTRMSLDNHELLVNSTLFFDLCNVTSGPTIGLSLLTVIVISPLRLSSFRDIKLLMAAKPPSGSLIISSKMILRRKKGQERNYCSNK